MNSTQHVLILGGGTGGTIIANRLRRTLPASVEKAAGGQIIFT
jgi:NADH dehydrogenase FAD-containing subunit